MTQETATRYEIAEKHLNRVLTRAEKHQLPWDRKDAKINAMRAILLSWAANYPACMNSLEDHAEI
jgi:hypothetical protein